MSAGDRKERGSDHVVPVRRLRKEEDGGPQGQPLEHQDQEVATAQPAVDSGSRRRPRAAGRLTGDPDRGSMALYKA